LNSFNCVRTYGKLVRSIRKNRFTVPSIATRYTPNLWFLFSSVSRKFKQTLRHCTFVCCNRVRNRELLLHRIEREGMHILSTSSLPGSISAMTGSMLRAKTIRSRSPPPSAAAASAPSPSRRVYAQQHGAPSACACLLCAPASAPVHLPLPPRISLGRAAIPTNSADRQDSAEQLSDRDKRDTLT
jgi:hypothetical protein